MGKGFFQKPAYLKATTKMKLTKLPNTCSMYELGEVSEKDFKSINKFKSDIEGFVFANRQISFDEEYEEMTVTNPVKQIIYNTNFGTKRVHGKLKASGFRLMKSYAGHGNSKVYTFIKTVK